MSPNPPPLVLVVDPSDPRPVYRQIADGIAWRVSTGELRPGDPLPAVRDLAGDLGLNLNTVARAYRELAADRIADVGHGRRAVVASEARDRRPDPGGESELREEVRRLRGEAFRRGIGLDRLLAIVREELAENRGPERIG